MNEKALEF